MFVGINTRTNYCWALDEECEQLEMFMEELLEVTARLLTKYRLEKDIKSNEKLSSEIEQIKIEF